MDGIGGAGLAAAPGPHLDNNTHTEAEREPEAQPLPTKGAAIDSDGTTPPGAGEGDTTDGGLDTDAAIEILTPQIDPALERRVRLKTDLRLCTIAGILCSLGEILCCPDVPPDRRYTVALQTPQARD
jgi:hypothetical protein